MTQRTFVIMTSKYLPIEYRAEFMTGLNKGLEISKVFVDWVDDNYYRTLFNKWKCRKDDIEIETTSELLEIFLTENHGKWNRQ